MEHWIYKDCEYFKMWVEMLFRARFSEEPKKDIYQGSMYTLNRSEFLFSRPKWSERLGINSNKVYKCIKLLEDDNMIIKIGRVGKSGATIYSICNYEKYNKATALSLGITDLEGNSQQPSNSEATTKQQRSNSEATLKNNVNTAKSVNNENIKDIVDYLNLKSNKSFKYGSSKTQTCINARLKDGFTLDNFKTVIDLKVKEWINDKNMAKYIRPETLFGTKFEGYLNENSEVKQDAQTGSIDKRVQEETDRLRELYGEKAFREPEEVDF